MKIAQQVGYRDSWWLGAESDQSLGCRILSNHSVYPLDGVRVVARGGIEPPTQGFSVLCSTN